MFGRAPVAAETRIVPVDRELVMSIKTVDYAFLLESGDDRWIEHFEAESVLSPGDLAQICRRATLRHAARPAAVLEVVGAIGTGDRRRVGHPEQAQLQ
ncbi:MAG: hypothetical protein R2729_21735 [Bryobacteraceae bacterium]